MFTYISLQKKGTLHTHMRARTHTEFSILDKISNNTKYLHSYVLRNFTFLSEARILLKYECTHLLEL